MKRKTELLIEMAWEIYAEKEIFGYVAETYETLNEVCEEYLQTPLNRKFLGNIKIYFQIMKMMMFILNIWNWNSIRNSSERILSQKRKQAN